jgi:UDP-N-acetylglucosamine--N-acetylmuramyl-(pentapeptide) pyrophosphoryl-undecaprenol N-acetylglucosamine transferase
MSQRTLMVMAGGTGGHVYPAMAVADVLLAKGWRIVWLCTEGGMENRLIADKAYDKAMIRMRGVRGKGVLAWLTMPWSVLRAMLQSLAAIRQYRPSVLLGMGGFAAFPGAVAGRLLAKPLVIHEQNSVAGLSNRVLSKLAQRSLQAFPNALKKAELVGNPVRQDICALDTVAERFARHQGKLRVLVVGGSLGAQALNDAIPAALALLPEQQRPEVVHQSGTKHIAALRERYQQCGVTADCRDYLEDMAHWYDWADFVICRAGAMTVAELAAVGLGSLLVPFPFAVDDHQTTNAQYLAKAGAAYLLQQKDMQLQALAELLAGLNRERCLAMAQAAAKLGKPNAAVVVAQRCEELLG